MIKELKKSGICGVPQRNNIHLKVCAPGEVAKTLMALRDVRRRRGSKKCSIKLFTNMTAIAPVHKKATKKSKYYKNGGEA